MEDQLVDFEEDLERFAEDSFIQSAIGQGVDLRGYSRQIEQELRDVEVDSVRDYVAQSEQVVELHNDMQSCDAILKRMQEMLLGFQADLVGISDEIKHLQDESLSMNVKLRNRRAVESGLKGFLDQVVVPPAMVASLCGGDMNDAYLEYVIKLNSRLHFVEGTSSLSVLGLPPAETAAGREVIPELDRLRNRAVAKAREYMLLKIGELRKPKTNVQMIQKAGLLKYHYLMQFLMECSPATAQEVRVTYTESMSRTIHSVFKAYGVALSKLDLVIADKHTLIAVEEGATKGVFSSKMDLSKRGDAFTLSTRTEVLSSFETPPILVHVAQAEGTFYPYEAIFKSVLKHLCDASTNEFLFGVDFFRDRSAETFTLIMSRTISLVLENLENYLFSCWDIIGLLLMIKVNNQARQSMLSRRIPVLESFFDRVNMLLWPRVKVVFDGHLKSVELANPRQLGRVSKCAHYVTRRYAEFTSSVLSLHGGVSPLGSVGDGDDMLLGDLGKLQLGLLGLLRRLSEELPTSKQKVVFLINNYDQAASVFRERGVDGVEGGAEGEAGGACARFEELLAQHRGLFVEEELLEGFGAFIGFVQHAEGLDASGVGDPESLGAMDALVRDFAATWKDAIEAIYRDVLDFFSDLRNGNEILKQVLTQLLLYYTRFQEIIKKAWGRRQPPFAKDLISTATILVEIKKYSRGY